MKFKLFVFVLVLILASTSFSQMKPRSDQMKGHNKKGMQLYHQGELDKAEHEFKLTLKKNKKNLLAREMLAQIYYMKKNYKDAFKQAEIVIKQNPNLCRSHLTLGAIYFKRGEKEKARKEFKQARENAKTKQEKEKVRDVIAKIKAGEEELIFPQKTQKAKKTLTISPATEMPEIQATRKPYVAVFPFKETNVRRQDTNIGVTISEMLITALIQTDRFNVMERTQLQKVLKEQSLSQTGAVDPETAVEVGKLVGLEAVVIGSVSQLKSVIEGDARLIEVETAKALTAVNGNVNNIDNARDLATQLARKLAKKVSLIETKDDTVEKGKKQLDTIQQEIKK